MIEASFLDLLACPACPDRPKLTDAGDALVCTTCGRRYPVVDGIPHLLVEEASLPEEGNP
ncbi:MAG: Trm112 family protein [Fimbriimonadaceae bacterium]|nr:Trm112 family protein [Fimbriimonadaceae bacterium]